MRGKLALVRCFWKKILLAKSLLSGMPPRQSIPLFSLFFLWNAACKSRSRNSQAFRSKSEYQVKNSQLLLLFLKAQTRFPWGLILSEFILKDASSVSLAVLLIPLVLCWYLSLKAFPKGQVRQTAFLFNVRICNWFLSALAPLKSSWVAN